MVGKINSLAFHPYPTFVILTTSMDTILKTVSVVILKWYHNFTLDDIAAFSLFAEALHTNCYTIVNDHQNLSYNTLFQSLLSVSYVLSHICYFDYHVWTGNWIKRSKVTNPTECYDIWPYKSQLSQIWPYIQWICDTDMWQNLLALKWGRICEPTLSINHFTAICV